MTITYTLPMDSTADFQTIIGKLHEAQSLLQKVKEKMQFLKKTYNELIHTYHKNMFVFSLDSFFFKYKLLEFETEHYSNALHLINNRMYGDYYKLYNILFAFSLRHQPMEHVRKYNPLKNSTSKLPVTALPLQGADSILHLYTPKGHNYDPKGTHTTYTDLKPFQPYTTQEIHVLHLDIMNMCVAFTKNEHTTAEAKEQMSVFLNYISFFHHTQTDTLGQLIQKITHFYNELVLDNYSQYIETFLQKHDLSMPNHVNKSREPPMIFPPFHGVEDIRPLVRSRQGSPLVRSRNGSPFGTPPIALSRQGTPLVRSRNSSPIGRKNPTWGISYERAGMEDDSINLYNIYDISKNTIQPPLPKLYMSNPLPR